MKKNITLTFILFISIIATSVSPLFPLTKEQEAEALNRGKTLIFDGKIQEGIKILEEASSQGENPNIMYYLAKGYSWSGNFKKAIEYYKRVQFLTNVDDVMYWQAQFGLAQVTSWQQKYEEAIAMYNRILTDYKKIPVYLTRETYIAIGDVYSWKLEISKAIGYFNKALESDPQSVMALNRIAKVYMWSKNYKESKKYSQKVLDIDKDNLEAKNRIESLDLLWNYSVTLGNTITLFDFVNAKGEKVTRDTTIATFDWPVSDNFGLHFEATYATQNLNGPESDIPATATSEEKQKASEWTGDINVGIGANGKIFENTYYSGLFNYTFSPKNMPDWSGEGSINQKITQNIDILFAYKLIYNSKYEEQRKESPTTHSFSPGFIYYISELIFSQLQVFYDTDGKDKMYSVLFHQTFTFTSSDKVEVYLSYGKGTSYTAYADTTLATPVTTTGISFSYLHFFSTKFGIRPSVEYHDRVNSYYDISFGLQGIYNI